MMINKLIVFLIFYLSNIFAAEVYQHPFQQIHLKSNKPSILTFDQINNLNNQMSELTNAIKYVQNEQIELFNNYNSTSKRSQIEFEILTHKLEKLNIKIENYKQELTELLNLLNVNT